MNKLPITMTINIDKSENMKDVVGVDEFPDEFYHPAEVVATCGDIQVVDTNYIVVYDISTDSIIDANNGDSYFEARVWIDGLGEYNYAGIDGELEDELTPEQFDLIFQLYEKASHLTISELNGLRRVS